jgi:hypothetical protein
MTVLTPTLHRSLVRPALVVAGVFVAAVLNAMALGSGRGSLVAAVPVALAFVLVAGRWPSCAALGLAGLVAFDVALVARASAATSPEPLPVAVAVVLAAGAVLVRLNRARWQDVLGGLFLAYLGAAFLFEVGAVL